MNCDVTPRAANIFEVGLGYATDTGPRAKFGWKKPWINSRGHSLSSSTEVSSDEQLVDLSYKIPVVANPLEEYWLAQGAMKRDVVNDTDSNNMTLALSRNWEFSTGWQRSIGVHWMFDSFTQAGVSSNTMLVYPSISFSRTRSRGGMMPYWGDTQRYSIDTGTHYLGSDVDFIIMQAHGTLIRTPWRGHRFVVRGSAGKIKTNDFARPAILRGRRPLRARLQVRVHLAARQRGTPHGRILHGDGQHRISVQPHGQVVDGRLLRRGRSQQQLRELRLEAWRRRRHPLELPRGSRQA